MKSSRRAGGLFQLRGIRLRAVGSLKKTSAIMKSPMSIVQDRPYRRRAKRAYSQESTGLTGHNWSNLRHGLFRAIIVPHAAMR